MTRRVKSLLPILLLQAPLLAAQSPLPGSMVEGEVVNAITGAPVAGAHVLMWPVPSPGGSKPSIAITDAAGRFRFPSSPPKYIIDVREPGYLSARTPSEVWQGPSSTSPRFAITPEAVISGRLTGADGFPVSRAFLVANRYTYADGELKMIQGGSSGQTNERGEFRIGNLPAGRYSLRVSVMGSLRGDTRYTEQFYPGTIEPRASGEIEVRTGEERSGIDFRLSTHVGAIIAGRIEGAAAPDATVRLLTTKRRELLPSLSGTASADGAFTISQVPPGTYVLQARTGRYPPQLGDLFVERQIQVRHDDLRNIVLEIRAVEPMQLSGAVTLEDGSTRPLVVGIQKRGECEVGGRLSNTDGSFVLCGLLPGHYFVTVMPDCRFRDRYVNRPASEWMPIIVSATLDGKDILKEGFYLDGTDPGPLHLIVRLP